MSARENAQKRLIGQMDGSDWAKADAAKGIGWALLHLADVIAESVDKLADSRMAGAKEVSASIDLHRNEIENRLGGVEAGIENVTEVLGQRRPFE